MKRKNLVAFLSIITICSTLLIGCNKETDTSTTQEQGSITSQEEDTTLDNNFNKDYYLKKIKTLEEDLSSKLKDKYSGTTLDMLEASNTEFTEWDKLLNEIYSDLMNNLSKEEKESLIKEEEAWIKERDQKAKEAGDKNKDGSLEKVSTNMSLIESTKTRCNELVNKYID